MTERLPARSWAPAREAPVLLTIQLIALWQVSLRGIDYLHTPTRAALDAAAVSATAGLVLLGASLTVLIGIAGRWGSAIIAGHALIGAWYLGLGAVALGDTSSPRSTALVGLALGAGGVLVLVHRRAPTWARLTVAVPAMLAGQVIIAAALGPDYRSGTGLLGQGCIHLALAAGTALLWQRRRLAEVVAREVEGVPRD